MGVGALVGDLPLPDGRLVSYAAFVAPAMLASSAMTGALAETTFNFFGKMKYMKLYDGMLATPVRPFEIALGELGWAMLRGSALLGGVPGGHGRDGSDQRRPGRWPPSRPRCWSGSRSAALGMAISTFMRSWQDFDLMGSAQFTLFLFSGTFVPARPTRRCCAGWSRSPRCTGRCDLIRGISLGAVAGSGCSTCSTCWRCWRSACTVAARRMGRLLYR